MVDERAISKNSVEFCAVNVAAQQLGFFIAFASSKSNISKGLKQALLRHRKSTMTAKHKHGNYGSSRTREAEGIVRETEA